MDYFMDFTLEDEMLNRCDIFLGEAALAASKYEEIPIDTWLFEANNNAAVAANDQLAKQAEGGIGGALNALIRMIKNMITKLSNFIQTMFMGKEEREKFKAFREACKNDPKFANQEVSVRDFRALDKYYKSALDKINDLANRDDFSTEEVTDAVNSCISEVNALTGGSSGTKKAATAAVTKITMNLLADYCESNKKAAKVLDGALNSQLGDMLQLEQAVGKREAKKFKNKLRKSAKDGFLHRMKCKLLRHRQQSFLGCCNQNLQKLFSFVKKDKNGNYKVTVGSLVKGAWKNKDVAWAAFKAKNKK